MQSKTILSTFCAQSMRIQDTESIECSFLGNSLNSLVYTSMPNSWVLEQIHLCALNSINWLLWFHCFVLSLRCVHGFNAVYQAIMLLINVWSLVTITSAMLVIQKEIVELNRYWTIIQTPLFKWCFLILDTTLEQPTHIDRSHNSNYLSIWCRVRDLRDRRTFDQSIHSNR